MVLRHLAVLTLLLIILLLGGSSTSSKSQRVVAQSISTSGVTSLITRGYDGSPANGDSFWPMASEDGRMVVFYSWASNLVPDDTNGIGDVFVYDRVLATTTRVSVASDGTQANAGPYDYWFPGISGNGRFVVFESQATNLVANDTNGYTDLFIHDLQLKTTQRISVASGGTQANYGSNSPSISEDGRFITFYSAATNLVPGIAERQGHIYLHDRMTTSTTLVSVGYDGTPGAAGSQDPAISADGRFIAFMSYSQNLLSPPSESQGNIYVWDRLTGAMDRVSVSSMGEAANARSNWPSISADGRYVVYYSEATNLVPNDTNEVDDVFFFDRVTRHTERISVSMWDIEADDDTYYRPYVSHNGQFVAFHSSAGNLLDSDTNDVSDSFIRDRFNTSLDRISVASDGSQGDDETYAVHMSNNGRFVVYESLATNLVSGDTNGFRDIFLHDRFPGEAITISGRVLKQTGLTTVPAEGILIDAGPAGTATTDAMGQFTLAVPGRGRYQLTPKGHGLVFLPTHWEVEVEIGVSGILFRALDPAADDDGDRLLNAWELAGYDHDHDGRIDVDLPALGSHPLHKDLFLEVDYMVEHPSCGPDICVSSGHSHRPKQGAIQKVVDAFAAAPVLNPDRRTGITLHVDYGAETPVTSGATWGSATGSDILPHQEKIEAGNAWDRTALGDLRARYFTAARRGIFYYVVFAHHLGGDIPAGVSGIATNTGTDCNAEFRHGSDTQVVSLGSWTDGVGTVNEQAGTVMHELGHNLGLCHGGGTHELYKPNYLSVLNYAFQTRGLIKDGTEGTFDYSRYLLPSLDETQLNEEFGLRSDGFFGYGTRFFCQPNGQVTERVVTDAYFAIDWNCDNQFQSAVNTDVNKSQATTTLIGYNDWEHISFAGRVPFSAPRSPQLRQSPPIDELTIDEDRTLSSPYGVQIEGGVDLVVSPDVTVTRMVTVTNSGTMTATLSLSATPNRVWIDTSSLPSQLVLGPAEDQSFAITITTPYSTTQPLTGTLSLSATPDEAPAMGDVITLAVRTGPLAWFVSDVVTGTAPLMVNMTDLSVGVLTDWYWDFGDGVTSHLQHPSHIYVAAGIYTVKLTVSGPDGSDIWIRRDLLTVHAQEPVGRSLYLPRILR